MTQLELTDQSGQPATKMGRKRDHSRDADILEAALEVLAETGYDGMTIDMVASRAKAGKATLYRRWPSKGELIIDAVACMKNAGLPVMRDTGSLRGDLVAMLKPQTIEDGERKMQVMAGLMSLISANPELQDAAYRAIIEPRAMATRTILNRAIERGEISADTDVNLLSQISQAMVSHRVLMLRKPVTREFLLTIIDRILMPAVGLRPEQPSTERT